MVETDSRLVTPVSWTRSWMSLASAGPCPAALRLSRLAELALFQPWASVGNGVAAVLFRRIPNRHFRAVLQFVEAARGHLCARIDAVNRRDVAVRSDRFHGLSRRSLIGIDFENERALRSLLHGLRGHERRVVQSLQE